MLKVSYSFKCRLALVAQVKPIDYAKGVLFIYIQWGM